MLSLILFTESSNCFAALVLIASAPAVFRYLFGEKKTGREMPDHKRPKVVTAFL